LALFWAAIIASVPIKVNSMGDKSQIDADTAVIFKQGMQLHQP
jgi:hypothetical protein